MKCPKCNHEQQGTVECERCGIIFAKFAAHQQRLREQENNLNEEEEPLHRNYLVPAVIGVVLVALIGGVVIYKKKGNSAPISPPVAVKVDEQSESNTMQMAGLQNLEKQLAEIAPPKNEIEKARNATVLIRTSWGSGSGFFVSSDCDILTNKHVVKIDEGKLAKAQADLDAVQEFFNKIGTVVEARKKAFYQKCNRCDPETYREYMGEFEEKLNAAQDDVAEKQRILSDINSPNSYKVTLADGTELESTFQRESTERDLALLKLSHAVCPFIERGDESTLGQGDTLYTVGNPIGLKFTVTAGIFSGFYNNEDVKLLQTDAPINPGNSGGPLLDKHGRVVGINTLVVKNTQGIGFAIPASEAFTEFGL
jgi:serine protease Do